MTKRNVSYHLQNFFTSAWMLQQIKLVRLLRYFSPSLKFQARVYPLAYFGGAALQREMFHNVHKTFFLQHGRYNKLS
jgi:hypothetical protein